MAFEIVDWSIGTGTVALSPLPTAKHEFDALRAWLPDVIVSLTLDEETGASLGVLQRGDWEWHHNEITDFGTPDAAFDAVWPDMSARLLMRLQAGGRVLVHCRGGCGRSGMVVLALMVAAGQDFDKALKRLRARRPCAVETDAQLAWAKGLSLQKHS
ncbi:Dual specificity phosphatase, catalytic domain [Shimia sp. SK013]|uniref:protein-tyrosine phosphatase family protein n=1 Tax=Shimia sp. SK013 TaxID=1389006 RepID=UPI0006B5E86A|nr:dual specificity protein phosphatase family protein [Shimia sp. SK013]KPA23248.1 Dual specificity phosphatase, catalytic domain [Shimia sp. SK013]